VSPTEEGGNAVRRVIALGGIALALVFGSALPATAAPVPAAVSHSSDDDQDVVLPQPWPQLADTGVSAGDRALLGLGLAGGGLLLAGAIVFAVTAHHKSKH
jgi:hypothetical protein